MTTIRTPENQSEWNAYYDLRWRIMREPLGKPRGSERNEQDATGTHLALFENGVIKAIAKLDPLNEQTAQVRFVAVESAIQSSGYGRKIMDAIEKTAAEQGFSKLILHARDYALPFYEKLQYTLVGPSYKLFDVLQHFEMYKQLD